MAFQGVEALGRWPSLGVTFGILGGVYMGFLIVPAAVALGFGTGWLAGFGVWALRKMVAHITYAPGNLQGDGQPNGPPW